MKTKTGFTLIELLIVIGILAVLSSIVVLVLNPTELLRQSRDTQRLTDLKSIKGAIDIYLLRNTSSVTSLDGPDATTLCESGDTGFPQWRISIPSSSPIGAGQGRGADPFVSSGPSATFQAPVQSASPRLTNGTGWVSVNFEEIIGNTPLPRLPLDPINVIPPPVACTFSQLSTPTAACPNVLPAYYYAYQCQGLTYEMNANMESQKYSNGGSKDVEKNDGGTLARSCKNTVCNAASDFDVDLATAELIYETGNKPGLDL